MEINLSRTIVLGGLHVSLRALEVSCQSLLCTNIYILAKLIVKMLALINKLKFYSILCNSICRLPIYVSRSQLSLKGRWSQPETYCCTTQSHGSMIS
jgi:hypothetical protein